MSVLEKRSYNIKVVDSAEYQRILLDVMNEVYTIFTEDRLHCILLPN